MKRFDSREGWLSAAVQELRPIFKVRGYKLPDKIHVSVGFPLGRRAGERLDRCYGVHNGRDGAYELFVSPMLDEPVKVLGSITHNLCHLAVGMERGHKHMFTKCAGAMGLEPPWIETNEGEAFKAGVARPVLAALAMDYPHERITLADAHTGPKKQATRLIKCECETCGYNVRTTMKWLLTVGAPLCPTPGCKNAPMKAEIPR